MAAQWSVERLQKESSYWRAAILLTAAHLDLFRWFAKRKLKAEAVAARYGGNRESWESFLNALSGIGLMRKQAGRYSTTAFSERHLTGDGRALLLPAYDVWNAWGQLAAILTTAKRPATQRPFATDRAQSARLLQALHIHARQIAPHVIQKLLLNGARTLLDVGGGLGTFTCAVCRRYPRLQATLVEHPKIAPLARRSVRDAGLAKRIRVIARDFTRNGLPVGFDAVFVSNVLHAHSASRNLGLLREVHRSLNPGGQLILRDVFMSRERTAPEWGALFSVALLLHTPHGRCYSLEEICGWLRQANFSIIRGPMRSSPLPFDPDAILIAKKT
ncbi:MAG TPA: methyltransferase [Candidatus Binatia bacterium]|nr:methyltransferase [Candidatus Binatia bacterium]